MARAPIIPSCCARPHRMIRWGLSVSHPPFRPPGRPPSHPSHTACGTDGGSLRRRWKAWKGGRAGRGRARGGRCRPSLALPPSPGLGARTARDRLSRRKRAGCPGRTRGALAPGGRGPSAPDASRRATRHPHKSPRGARRLVGMAPPPASAAPRSGLDPTAAAGRGAINDCDARHGVTHPAIAARRGPRGGTEKGRDP